MIYSCAVNTWSCFFENVWLGLFSSIRCKNVEWILARCLQRNIQLSGEVGVCVCAALSRSFSCRYILPAGSFTQPCILFTFVYWHPYSWSKKKECVNLSSKYRGRWMEGRKVILVRVCLPRIFRFQSNLKPTFPSPSPTSKELVRLCGFK